MSILKVYNKADPGPNGALTVTGEVDPDDPNIERAHMFARVDNPASDPVPVAVQTNNSVTDIAESVSIYNVSATTAGTEYSQALSADVKWFLIKARQNATLQLAFTATQSGTNFVTIPAGATYTQDKMSVSSLTLYFQSNVNNTDVEIVEGS